METISPKPLPANKTMCVNCGNRVDVAGSRCRKCQTMYGLTSSYLRMIKDGNEIEAERIAKQIREL